MHEVSLNRVITDYISGQEIMDTTYEDLRQALARMWNQRYPGIPARACDDFRSAAAIAAWLNSHDDR